MKQLIILMTLSFSSLLASAQEITEVKGDRSYLEGLKFLQEMNKNTQAQQKRVPPQEEPEQESVGFTRSELHEMTQFMKELSANAKETTKKPAEEEEHDTDSKRRGRAWTSGEFYEARMFIRRLGDNTTAPSSSSSSSSKPAAQGAPGSR
ncbi:hypothetical protein [Bdellovibrio sp. HCB337]|uniref:hypothetical protein n=1 Tax=Bdellovibrio sp. HCB337 TaxID=3394358 RepID=UPI0039A5455A